MKGGRFITHMKRLNEVAKPTANFFASGVLALREKLGPILWQLPPQFAYDRERLETFFQLLPRDTSEAAALAKTHDDKVRKGVLTQTDRIRPLRHSLEVRHPSFITEEFIQLLRKHDIGLVVADTAGKWPFLEDVTSDFVYVRLHGDEQLYVSGYSKESLDAWAEKVRLWSRGGTPPGRLAAPEKLARKSARSVLRVLRQRRESARPFRCDVAGSPPRTRTSSGRCAGPFEGASAGHESGARRSEMEFNRRPASR